MDEPHREEPSRVCDQTSARRQAQHQDTTQNMTPEESQRTRDDPRTEGTEQNPVQNIEAAESEAVEVPLTDSVPENRIPFMGFPASNRFNSFPQNAAERTQTSSNSANLPTTERLEIALPSIPGTTNLEWNTRREIVTNNEQERLKKGMTAPISTSLPQLSTPLPISLTPRPVPIEVLSHNRCISTDGQTSSTGLIRPSTSRIPCPFTRSGIEIHPLVKERLRSQLSSKSLILLQPTLPPKTSLLLNSQDIVKIQANKVLKQKIITSTPQRMQSTSFQGLKSCALESVSKEVPQGLKTIFELKTKKEPKSWEQLNQKLLSEVAGTSYDTVAGTSSQSQSVKCNISPSPVCGIILQQNILRKKKNLKGMIRVASKTLETALSSSDSSQNLTKQNPPSQTKRTNPRRLRKKRSSELEKDSGASGYPVWEDDETDSSSQVSENSVVSISDMNMPLINLEEKISAYLSCIERQLKKDEESSSD